MIKCKVVKSFLGIPIDTVGVVTTKEGHPVVTTSPHDNAMWIKFDCKDMPVGLCLPFGMHVALLIAEA